jgi:formylmethanofuran dehydrogenase subunit A
MSADFRKECIQILPEKIKSHICLPELTREYTLFEIAIITSAGPARALGLPRKGSLGVGCDADVVIYNPQENLAEMFGHPRYVIKGGEIVIDDGDICATPQGRELIVQPDVDPDLDNFLRPRFEDCYSLSFENYPVEMERLDSPEIHECRPFS